MLRCKKQRYNVADDCEQDAEKSPFNCKIKETFMSEKIYPFTLNKTYKKKLLLFVNILASYNM